MKKKKQEKVVENPMKNVLDDLRVKVSVDSSKKKFSLKEAIWNYPNTLYALYKKSIPISYIVIFLIVASFLVWTLSSSSILEFKKGRGNKDTYTEGLIGSVNSLNPLFVTNNFSDRAIQSLVFQKFVNIDKEGNPIAGVAKSWVSSENGLVVDFVIDSELKWSDGTELTVDDVLFTFNTAMKLAQESDYDSVGEAFVGIEIERIDDTTLRFRLKERNPLFFKAISIYIVPQSRLGEVDIGRMVFDQFSKQPMGCGKYMVNKIDDREVILEDNPYDKYMPEIKKVVFRIFSTLESEEMAFRVGQLNGIGGWDRDMLKYTNEYKNFTKYSLAIRDREKLIFFNIRKDTLKDANMRKALNFLLDKEKFFEDLNVGGDILYGPLPSTSWAYNDNFEKYLYNPEKAVNLLKDLGYTLNSESGYYENEDNEILSFALSYLDTPTNNRIVDLLVEYYKKEGVFIKPKEVEYDQITQEVIATRNFEMLLYEVETTIDPDQYNLWHSLKVNHPDLNLSGYTYERVDIVLEDARKTTDRETRKERYALFQKYLAADSPAIFLYNPSYEYIADSDLVGMDLDSINNSYERFHNIETWYWK